MSRDDRRGWLGDLALDLGEASARRVCAASGGQRRHIPRKACSGWIAEAAGDETEIWLSERFGGEELQIPLLETNRQAERRRRMEAVAAAESVSANELAQRLGIHRRTVQRLRRQLREAAHRL